MIGSTLNNRYNLESELGHGGMGVVYRARDLSLNRAVAVKVLPPAFSMDAQFLARFKNEVLNVARLDHPHIAQIYDVGEDGKTHYYVMQLIEGSDLHVEILQRGRFSLEETIGILQKVASALDYAHEQGIVHRDIKPDNILLDRNGSPHVVDFGIAKSVECTRMTGGMIGTPEYMSPEQARGEAIDGRADQYALAIVAYEMLTGTTPFRSDTAQAWSLVNAHINVQPPDPRQWQGDLPEHVVGSMMQALAKVPGNRFASCAQFIDALAGHSRTSAPPETAMVTQTVYQSLPPPSVEKVPTPRNHSGIHGFLGALVGILLLGGSWLLFGQKIIGGNNSQAGHSTSGYHTPAPVPNQAPVVDTKPPSDDVQQTAQSGSPASNSSEGAPHWGWTSDRQVTDNDLQGLGHDDLELMRNEIYARHGWIFKRQDLQAYFTAQSWYKPAGAVSQRDSVDSQVGAGMSALEKLNAEKILNKEKAQGGA